MHETTADGARPVDDAILAASTGDAVSYFDHVRCTACKATLDPESLVSVQGQGMSCPQCKAPLSLTDLFGLRDAFAEEESPDLSLDDLVAGPSRPAAPAPQKPAPRTSGRTPVKPTSGGLVRRVAPPEEAAPSALDLMRSMKKKR